VIRAARSGVLIGGAVVTCVRFILISGVIIVRRRSSASFLAWGCIPVLIQSKPVSEILVALIKCSNARAKNEVLCASSGEAEPKRCIVSRRDRHTY
jgi:hypothetical protein